MLKTYSSNEKCPNCNSNVNTVYKSPGTGFWIIVIPLMILSSLFFVYLAAQVNVWFYAAGLAVWGISYLPLEKRIGFKCPECNLEKITE